MISKKILIVDRNLDSLIQLRKVLGEIGFQIMTANDMLTAERLERVTKFDYILLNREQGEQLLSVNSLNLADKD